MSEAGSARALQPFEMVGTVLFQNRSRCYPFSVILSTRPGIYAARTPAFDPP